MERLHSRTCIDHKDNGLYALKGKENGKIRMKVSVIDILFYCSMCMY